MKLSLEAKFSIREIFVFLRRVIGYFPALLASSLGSHRILMSLLGNKFFILTQFKKWLCQSSL